MFCDFFENQVETPDLEFDFSCPEQQLSIKERRVRQKLKIKKQPAQNVLSKEELRKMKNRESAQESRDRKRWEFEYMRNELQSMRKQLEQKEQEIKQLKEREAKLYEYINKVQQTNIDVDIDSSTEVRPQYITKQKLATFGLFALLSFISLFCLMGTQKEQVSVLGYLNDGINQQQQLTQLETMSMENRSQKRSQRSQTFSKAIVPASYDNQMYSYDREGEIQDFSFKIVIESREGLKKVLFVNCDLDENQQCQKLINYLVSREINYFQKESEEFSPKLYEIPTSIDNEIKEGQMVTIVNIGEAGDKVFLDKIDCYVKNQCRVLLNKQALEDL